MSTTDLNLNVAECLRTVSDFGQSTVHNICNGQVHTLAWGTADWVLGVCLTALGITLIAGLAAFVIIQTRDAL